MSVLTREPLAHAPLTRRNPTVKLAALTVVSVAVVFVLDPVTPAVLYVAALVAVAAGTRATARTLALGPDIILFDEPMSALDVETRLSLRAELKRIQREYGTTMIYITHDQEEAFAMSDRIMVMGAGRIHQLASPDEIVDAPADGYVEDFVLSNLRAKLDSLARFMGR